MLVMEQTIPMMLRGAMLSYATVRGWDIEDSAGESLVSRAFTHIRTPGDVPPRILYSRALTATLALPRFFDRMEMNSASKRLESVAAANDVIKKILGTPLGSVYPWCTDLPTP
jgi:hypothetical protein